MRRKTRIRMFLLCVIMMFTLGPITASADTGPKPSVHITFENLGDEICYGTLLSRVESTGPSYAWDGKEGTQQHNENPNGQYDWVNYGYDVWKAFVDFDETDDFYFLQEAWKVNEIKTLKWGYYPPDEFKILLYFPETGEYALSEVYGKYAFDSYFTATLDGGNLMVEKSYNYRAETGSMVARIIITILIEMAIALLFGYREKKQLLLLVGVNAVTQIILNVLLNVANYNLGWMGFVIYYILFEIIVVVMEAILFGIWMNKVSAKQKPNWLVVVYALVANVVSFVAGMGVAMLLPGIF